MPLSVRLDPDGIPIAFGKVTDFEQHVHLHHMEDVVAKIEACAWTEMNRKAQAERAARAQRVPVFVYGSRRAGLVDGLLGVGLWDWASDVLGIPSEQLRNEIAEAGSDGYKGSPTRHDPLDEYKELD